MKLTLATALAALVAASAYAHDFRGDLLCQIRDNSGQVNNYAFANNSENADGSFGGTFVETGYKSARKTVAAVPGLRPIWIYDSNDAGGVTLLSRADPGWSIVIGRLSKNNGVWSGAAVLAHGDRAVGYGSCVRKAAMTAADVPDAGIE